MRFLVFKPVALVDLDLWLGLIAKEILMRYKKMGRISLSRI
jgi:hypothetical protein